MTKSKIFKFKNRSTALNFSAWTILGDDGLFWAVTPADFERLIRGGYSVA